MPAAAAVQLRTVTQEMVRPRLRVAGTKFRALAARSLETSTDRYFVHTPRLPAIGGAAQQQHHHQNAFLRARGKYP